MPSDIIPSRLQLDDPKLVFNTGWINGQPYHDSKVTFTLTDPATGQAWADVAAMDERATDAAIAAASDAFPAYSKLTARERSKLILRLNELFLDAKMDLARLMTLEMGKPLGEALGEIEFAAEGGLFAAAEGERVQGEALRSISDPSMRYITIREALGPIGLLAPWNFPMDAAYRKMVSALAAGCTCVIKPSPETPLSTAALGLLAKRAGFADGVVNIVTASYETTPEVGRALCEDPRLKGISFTGSTRIGKLIATQCAPTLKKVTLELGGNGGWAIFEDADLEKSADALIGNKFRNAGQVCVAANRIFVQRSVLPQFTKLMEERVKKLKLGHGLDEGTTMGPMTTERGVQACLGFVEDAVREGGRIVHGGKRVGEGFHFEPTVLVDVPEHSTAYKTELFSPICVLYAFDTEEEVVGKINSTPLGLTHYVWTRDIGRAWRCVDALKSGQVAVNSSSASAIEVPFGGIKESGYGKEGGYKYGLDDFLLVRVAAFRND